MNQSVIDRRTALRQAAYLMGGTLSAPTLLAILGGCKPEASLEWKPVLFTENQAITVSCITDIFIPETHTPGASKLGVPAFIEQVVKDCFTDDDKEHFISGLDAFIEGAVSVFDKPFTRLSAGRQTDYTTAVHHQAVAAEKANPVNYRRPFILICKELTLSGFFTSQIGAQQVLQYQAVPGSYEGCITLEEAGGKTWAS